MEKILKNTNNFWLCKIQIYIKFWRKKNQQPKVYSDCINILNIYNIPLKLFIANLEWNSLLKYAWKVHFFACTFEFQIISPILHFVENSLINCSFSWNISLITTNYQWYDTVKWIMSSKVAITWDSLIFWTGCVCMTFHTSLCFPGINSFRLSFVVFCKWR